MHISQESKSISSYFSSLKSSYNKTQAKNFSIELGPRSVDEGKRALGDGRAHSDEDNVGEQWPRKVRQHFGGIFLINLIYSITTTLMYDN